jgi:hypothetical protein
MRNANAQRRKSMVPADALQQLGCEHVSHAETGGLTGHTGAFSSEVKTGSR